MRGPYLAPVGLEHAELVELRQRERRQRLPGGVGGDRDVEHEQLDQRAERLVAGEAALSHRHVLRPGQELARDTERLAHPVAVEPGRSQHLPQLGDHPAVVQPKRAHRQTL